MASMPPGQDNQDTEKQTWCASELKSNEKNRRSWELELWCSLAYGILIGPSKLGSSRIIRLHPCTGQHFCAGFLHPLVIGGWLLPNISWTRNHRPKPASQFLSYFWNHPAKLNWTESMRSSDPPIWFLPGHLQQFGWKASIPRVFPTATGWFLQSV